MNKNGFFIFLTVCFVFFLVMSVSACTDEILTIEQQNEYSWQRYMNEHEFNELKEGMSYMEVVQTAGGAGREVESGVYEWNDEQLLTKGYILTFEDEKLVEMQVVERRGHSTR